MLLYKIINASFLLFFSPTFSIKPFIVKRELVKKPINKVKIVDMVDINSLVIWGLKINSIAPPKQNGNAK